MWMITWGDKSWTADDLTVLHLVAIVAARGVDDWDFNPTKGPMRLLYVLAAFIVVDEGRPVDQVISDLSKLPASVLDAALETG